MIKKVVVVIAMIGFLFHFILTAAYLTPLNPVKIKYSSLIYGYMEPLFSQNWQLFAPNPASNNNRFYVKVEFENGEKTDWIDLTSYMLEKDHNNRFTPFNRLVRIQRGAFSSIYQKDDIFIKLSQKVHENNLEPENFQHILENEQYEVQLEEALKILNRYAHGYVGSLFPSQKILRTQIVMQETNAIPFSKKDEEDYESEQFVHPLDWVEYEDVAPIF